MLRFRHVLLAALASAALAVPATAGPEATPTRLQGTVGPGFTITLKKGGKTVKSLKAGRYRFAISDKSGIHNFHLKGPGVNKDSGVAKVGNSSYTVTLRKGKYTFVCDPHASTMKGTFRVT